MAKNEKSQGATVTSLILQCIGEGCKKKPDAAGFCEEHFIWFKEGMLTKEGKKPSDFDKKLVNFMRRKKAA